MADTNRVQVSYVEEATWGLNPGGSFTTLPITGGSMTHGQDTTRSAVLRSDAQQSDAMRTGISPTASYDFEVAAGQFDRLMHNALRASAAAGTDGWSVPCSVDSDDISAVTGTPDSFESAGGDWLAGDVVLGQWVYVAGFAATNNNGWFRVTSVDANTMEVAGTRVTAEAAPVGNNVTVKGAFITNGTTLPSWSIQQHFGDLDAATSRTLLTGAMIESFSMDIANSAIVTANASFTGKEMTQLGAQSGTGPAAVNTNEVLSEVDDFGSVWIDDEIKTFDVMSMSWNSASATRPAKALGSVANTQMNQNALDITGSLELYLNDATWGQITNYLAGTKFRLAFSLSVDGLGQEAGSSVTTDQYLFDFPSVLYTAEPGALGGVDSDVMASLDFSAEPGVFDSTDEKTVQIARVLV